MLVGDLFAFWKVVAFIGTCTCTLVLYMLVFDVCVFAEVFIDGLAGYLCSGRIYSYINSSPKLALVQ